MSTRKVIFASAVALALLSFVLAVVQLFPWHPEPVPQGAAFSTRFQPQPEVLAGIGSSRALSAVELGHPKPTQPARAQAPTRGSVRSARVTG
jgi:hypothetical protein